MNTDKKSSVFPILLATKTCIFPYVLYMKHIARPKFKVQLCEPT